MNPVVVVVVAAMDKLLDVEKLFRVEDASELADWNIPLSFMKPRHLEAIEGLEEEGTSWRIKDRVSHLTLAEEGGRSFVWAVLHDACMHVCMCACVHVCHAIWK